VCFAGSGGRRLDAVNADVGTLNKTAVARNQAAVRRAGKQLVLRAARMARVPGCS